MSEPGSFLIGKFALREGVLTTDQLFDCLQAQERNPSRPIGQIMVSRGYLRNEDLNRLLDLQKEGMERTERSGDSERGILFGKLVVARDLATEYQVNECLRFQGRMVEMGIQPVPMLGEIMVHRRYLKPEVVQTALQLQDLSLYTCPKCGSALVSSGDGGTTFACRSCGEEVPSFIAQMAAGARKALDEAAEEHDIEVPSEVSAAAEKAGNQFGNYILVQEIGRGGSGIVYRAWHRLLNKYVALKLLPHESETAAGIRTPYGDAEDIKRFYNEITAAADLQHPNIVPILDFAIVENHFFYAMKLIDGPTLDDLIREGGASFQTTLLGKEEFARRKEPPQDRGRCLPARAAIELVLPLVHATAYAHKRGIYHRDIKPGNIIIDKNRHLWLMDFGLAKVTKIGDAAYVKGVIMGTPYYMPPEQAQGDMELVDHSSDIYSLGAVLYELLTGTPPYGEKSADDVLDFLPKGPPDPPRKLVPAIPEEAAMIIAKAMQRSKRDRYPTAGAMAEDMRRYLEGEPLQEEPTGARARSLIRRVKRFLGES